MNDVKNAIRYEFIAEGDEDELVNRTSVVGFEDLEVRQEAWSPGLHKSETTPVGVAKRALAGLQSLSERADLRFETLWVKKVYGPLDDNGIGYDDFDIVFRVRTCTPEARTGYFSAREAQMEFTCAVHVTQSGRLEPRGLYVRNFEDRVVLKVTGSTGGERSVFVGKLSDFDLKYASILAERIVDRFVLETAFRQLADNII